MTYNLHARPLLFLTPHSIHVEILLYNYFYIIYLFYSLIIETHHYWSKVYGIFFFLLFVPFSTMILVYTVFL